MNTSLKNTINPNNMRWGLLVAILTIWFNAQASHIVGGDLYYRCLGGDQYEITMDVYRDCFFGDPNAYFDDPAFVGVFGPDNEFLFQLNMEPMGDDTLPPRIANECLFVPNTVCVHTSRYRDTVSLPALETGGYTITYQRCCRNETISNIIDPVATGATFSMFISSQALQACNSSPVFKDFPPIYICIGEPIDWDHGANDANGDSIVYKFTTPTIGGTLQFPKPIPTNPPYDTVVWNEGYSLDNILGAEEKMRIDPNTGFITGVPDRYGQFVVGVSMYEYRNGELLSIIHRDFQYNVGDCEAVQARIGNDSVQCEDNLVRFENNSTRAREYTWKFFDKNAGVEISSLENPVRLYSDTGLYKVRLIAEPNTECADSVDFNLLLKNSTVEADFETLLLNCSDSTIISTTNNSIDSVSSIVSYLWNVQNSHTTRSVETEPTFRLLNEGEDLEVTLIAFSSDGCTDTLMKPVDVTRFNGDDIRDTFALCEGDSVRINPSPFLGENISYSWSPSIGLSDASSPNPIAFPSENTRYKLMIRDEGNGCEQEFDVLVAVPNDDFKALADYKYITCEDDAVQLEFTDASTGGSLTLNGSRLWRFNNGEESTNSKVTIDAEPGEEIEAFLRVETAEGCLADTSIQLVASDLNLSLSYLYERCVADDIQLRFKSENQDSNFTIISRQWRFSNGMESTVEEPRVQANEGQMLRAELVVQTAEGCEASSEENLMVQTINEEPLADGAKVFCEGASVELNPGGNTAYEYAWSPAIYLDDPTKINPIATVDDTTVFSVTIKDPTLPGCESTDEITLLKASGIVNPNFDVDIDDCKPEVTIGFNNTSTVENAEIDGYRWEFSDGTVSDQPNPTLTFTEERALGVKLTVLTSEGCAEESDFADSIMVRPSTVNDLRITTANSDVIAGDTVYLIGFTTQPNTSFFWLPEDKVSDPNAEEVIHIAEEGERDFILNAIDANGCEATTTYRLTALANNACVEPNIFIPTAFTPNEDGENDILYVYGNDITDMELIIYNRWGERVFQSTDQSIGWDGTYKGKELEPNVYGFYLLARCGNGKIYTKKGNVSILR